MLAVARAILRARWCAYTGNNERKGIPFRTGGDETKKGLCSPYMPFARTYSSTNRKNVIRFLLCVRYWQTLISVVIGGCAKQENL